METVFSRQIHEDVADLKSREKEPFAKGIAEPQVTSRGVVEKAPMKDRAGAGRSPPIA